MSTAALITLVALLQASAASQPSSLVEDAGKLAAATTNEGRFDALTGLLKARGLPFTVEPFTIEKPVGREPRTEGRNIVVTIGDGADTILIGAHYDAARIPDGSLSRGAVDNAASSVMLVRVAEALKAESLPIRVRFVWFDMEELGLVGSARYVAEHASDRLTAMFNFDINASGDTIAFGPSDNKENAGLRRTFVQTCAMEDVSCVGFPRMPPGDDRSFVKAGVPTISVGIVRALEAHQLWLLMNGIGNSGLTEGFVPGIVKTLHTADDTLDKLNEDTMARMQRFALALVRGVAKK